LNEQAPTMVTWSNERFKSMLLEYDKAVLFTMPTLTLIPCVLDCWLRSGP
jgi:hypothetical protein